MRRHLDGTAEEPADARHDCGYVPMVPRADGVTIDWTKHERQVLIDHHAEHVRKNLELVEMFKGDDEQFAADCEQFALARTLRMRELIREGKEEKASEA